MNDYFGIWFQSILTRPCCLFSSSTSSSSLLSISLISLSTSSIPPSASFCVWVVLVYLWNSGLSLMSKYLNWNERYFQRSTIFKKCLEKFQHLFCRYISPCMDDGFHLPSKTHLPSSKTMILSINSKKPVWWVAMILIKSMMDGCGWWVMTKWTWWRWRGSPLAQSGGGRCGCPPESDCEIISEMFSFAPVRRQHSEDNQAAKAEKKGLATTRRIMEKR